MAAAPWGHGEGLRGCGITSSWGAAGCDGRDTECESGSPLLHPLVLMLSDLVVGRKGLHLCMAVVVNGSQLKHKDVLHLEVCVGTHSKAMLCNSQSWNKAAYLLGYWLFCLHSPCACSVLVFCYTQSGSRFQLRGHFFSKQHGQSGSYHGDLH